MMVPPNIEEFEERAAIAEFDGGLTRREAEDAAAQDQGFIDASFYWLWLAKLCSQSRHTLRYPRLADAGRGASLNFFWGGNLQGTLGQIRLRDTLCDLVCAAIADRGRAFQSHKYIGPSEHCAR